jgi:hypothetical protein
MRSSELATLHFYQWEYRNRGYYLFGTPIDIEPPYLPFYHKGFADSYSIDDGRVPSIFEQIISVFKSSKSELPKTEHDSFPLDPRFIDINDIPLFSGFSLSFPNGSDILPNRNIEFLSMLSFSEHPISFEIVGTHDDIQIQIVFSVADTERVSSQLSAYFPTAIIREIDVESFGFDDRYEVAIADFGLNNEFIRSITAADSFSIDPLTSIIATMDSLQQGDVVVFQMLFKGITSPLAKDIPYAVSDGAGESFFSDAPEMPQCAKDKISQPLFSVVMRVATQGNSNHRSQYLAQELSRSISSISQSEYNKLILLSNEGYAYDFHHFNLHYRTSNRLGFILNAKELSTFAHYPNKTIVSAKLGIQGRTTKRVAQEYINGKYILGSNEHYGDSYTVGINDEARLRHTHIIGVTGVGKSTLIANMMIEDMRKGNGCCLFDPHGDIVEDILLRIPEYRQKDVILIDPSYLDFPIGFNLLHASTEAEKMVLSSDLVGAFKRFATSWGDNMSAVLSQAINTFLESSKGGTLIELKRFLLEDDFRNEFLEHVHDPSIHYYWNNEYQFVRKGIASLLTRIDTFLRPKIIRYMFAQQHGVDFRACIEEKKILLIKLSQGLIGEENSYLLGSLFLSKFNQVAQGRQQLSKQDRHPYYIYLDEFQNFITNSITSILSGARKYGLGLILAHQELAQIDDPKILNSVISNPYIRICFRLGDRDAKQLESGFSAFEANDLQSLGIGEAIVRIGSSQNDCNITTSNLSDPSDISDIIRESVIEYSQTTYGKPRAEIEELLKELLPKQSKNKTRKKSSSDARTDNVETDKSNTKTSIVEQVDNIVSDHTQQDDATNETKISERFSLEDKKQKYLREEAEKESVRKHRSLQDYVRALALQRDFKATAEEQTENGGRVDIALLRNELSIAVEISVTNTLDYEVQNIQKCIDAGYTNICMLSESMVHLKNIKKRANKTIEKAMLKKVSYLMPLEFAKYLDGFTEKKPRPQNKRVRGYRVKAHHLDIASNQAESKNTILQNIILSSSKKK